MKWKYYPLSDDDPKAMQHISNNLSYCSMQNSLSKKLMTRVSKTGGHFFAIAFESLELERLTDYIYDGYYGGKEFW